MMRRDFKDIEVSEEERYDEAVRSRVGWSDSVHCVVMVWDVGERE